MFPIHLNGFLSSRKMIFLRLCYPRRFLWVLRLGSLRLKENPANHPMKCRTAEDAESMPAEITEVLNGVKY